MAAKNDWDAEAVRMANHVGENMFEAHRGAMPWTQAGVSVVFGNDGYAIDERSRNEVTELRADLEEIGVDVLGFGVSDEDGYTWAMLVASGDVEYLDSLVWWCWGVTSSPQMGIAADAIAEADLGPAVSVN